jgi:hypothetical protein
LAGGLQLLVLIEAGDTVKLEDVDGRAFRNEFGGGAQGGAQGGAIV